MGAGLHGGEARGVVEEAVELVGEHRQVVTADGDALFEEVVGVPLLLAGDGVDDREDEPLG